MNFHASFSRLLFYCSQKLLLGSKVSLELFIYEVKFAFHVRLPLALRLKLSANRVTSEAEFDFKSTHARLAYLGRHPSTSQS